MVATSVERRNYWLDALAGHQEYSYSFTPVTSEAMNVMLTNGGAPGGGGVGISNQYVLSTLSDVTVYPDSTDGATKIYTGGEVTFPVVEEDLDPATHILFYWNVFGYLFELDTPIQLLAGRAVTVTLPELTWDADGSVNVGMTAALRMRFLEEIFGNSESPLGPGEYYDLALFIGDPQEGGVEVDAWDYAPIRIQNSITYFTQDDPHLVYFRPPQTVRWPRCWTDWGEITHWGWKDVAATPTLHHSASFDASIEAVAGTLIEVEPDALTMTFGDPA